MSGSLSCGRDETRRERLLVGGRAARTTIALAVAVAALLIRSS
jgi:hypothetical protein